MRLIPLTALLLLACSTSTPTTSSSETPAVGSSAEALRKQRQLDADDVERCRDLAAQCTDFAGDAGFGRACDRLDAHCDQLEEQLAADRAELEQCLEAAAACEAAAADPAECADERAACEPADRDLRGRRGQTLECSNRAEQCFGGRRGRDDADAGALACEDGDDDFIGCCQGKHGRRGQRGDAGIDGDDRRPGFGFGTGFGGIDRDERADRNDDGDRDDAADAGRPRRRF
jgi:hypothetical protein